VKICRFEGERLGVVEDGEVLDVTGFLDRLPAHRWHFPLADPVIERLEALGELVSRERASLPRRRLSETALDAPVPRPGKIIGAPVNYHAHLEEARADRALHQGAKVHPIDEIGLFLKAGSALAGPGATVALCRPDRRSDHEAEVVVVIGREGRDIEPEQALGHVAGYSLGLDLSVRGREDRAMRKSPDGYAVLGPWLVTADEVADPGTITFSLTVGGETRQAGSTAALIRSVPELVAMASSFYTLHPGDLIYTGTPEGVAALAPGDQLRLESPELGVLEVAIA